MTLRKITIDSSVRFVKKDSHLHNEQTPLISKKRKKNACNNDLSQKNQKNIKYITAEGFGLLK